MDRLGLSCAGEGAKGVPAAACWAPWLLLIAGVPVLDTAVSQGRTKMVLDKGTLQEEVKVEAQRGSEREYSR